MSVPRIETVEALPGMRLLVRWDGGEVSEVDLSDVAREPGMAALADPDLFAQVSVADWGCTVEWPDGTDLSFRNLWQRSHRAAA